MKEMTASEFKAKCLRMLDELDDEGLVITKDGKPVARLVPIDSELQPITLDDVLGLRPDILVDPDDDYFSTGLVWEAELPADPLDRANFIVERKAMRHPAGR